MRAFSKVRAATARLQAELPARTQTIRFRLTILYSTVLFSIAAAGLAVTYFAVERVTDPTRSPRATRPSW